MPKSAMERSLDAKQILAAALLACFLVAAAMTGGVRDWSSLALLDRGVKTTARVVGKTSSRSSYNVAVSYVVWGGLYQSTSNVDGLVGDRLLPNDAIGLTVLIDRSNVAAIEPERLRSNGLGVLAFSFFGLILPGIIASIGMTRLRALA